MKGGKFPNTPAPEGGFWAADGKGLKPAPIPKPKAVPSGNPVPAKPKSPKTGVIVTLPGKKSK